MPAPVASPLYRAGLSPLVRATSRVAPPRLRRSIARGPAAPRRRRLAGSRATSRPTPCACTADAALVPSAGVPRSVELHALRLATSASAARPAASSLSRSALGPRRPASATGSVSGATRAPSPTQGTSARTRSRTVGASRATPAVRAGAAELPCVGVPSRRAVPAARPPCGGHALSSDSGGQQRQ